jgi:propionyl-CoA carboxylase beta chain
MLICLNPYTAAQRGFVDEVILPQDTRRKLIKRLAC